MDNKRVNPIVAGVAGAAIGAGMGVAATKVLSDKKTRDKVLHTISRVRNRVKKLKKTGVKFKA